MTGTDLVDRLAAHQTVGAAPREELAWLAAHGSLWHLDDGGVVSAAGAPVVGLHIVLTGHVAIFVDRGAGRHKVHGVARRGRHGRAPVLAHGECAGQCHRAGAHGYLRRPSRPLSRDDSRVPSGHVDARAQDARPRPGLHVERAARREDDLARQAVGGPGPRAEQPGVGHRAQRVAARGPSGGRRAGDARAGRRAADRSPARGRRRGARLLPRRAAVRACCRRSSRPNARTPSATGSRITGSTRPSPGRWPKPP